MLTALEQLSLGEIRQLMLLLPPGAAKSTYASRLFPAWWLSQHPQSSVIMCCHTARLAEHFGRGVRGLIDENSQLLGLEVRADQRAAGRFSTEQGGEFFGIGVHGAVTGRRADLALIDDPIRSFADAESFSAREHLWEWFRSELVTRMKPQGRMVLVMTRWHSDDLAGRLIQQGGWQVLRLPALAEAGDALGRAPGEALWPEWEDTAAIEAKRAMLGERQFAALFQQAPLRAGGQVFDPRLLRVVDAVPAGVGVRAWDLAGTSDASGDPDWTVGVKLVRDEGGAVFIDDVIRFRAVPGEVVERIRAAAVADGEAVTVGLPKDPGQAGKSQVMFLTQLLAGFRVEATPETGSKAVRAMPVAAQMQAGTLAMRRAGWNAMFLDELANFPEGRKDDQVDALSRAFSMLLGVKAPARFARLSFSSR
jgi:predicted phage terminase large subunit-like protein